MELMGRMDVHISCPLGRVADIFGVFLEEVRVGWGWWVGLGGGGGAGKNKKGLVGLSKRRLGERGVGVGRELGRETVALL